MDYEMAKLIVYGYIECIDDVLEERGIAATTEAIATQVEWLIEFEPTFREAFLVMKERRDSEMFARGRAH